MNYDSTMNRITRTAMVCLSGAAAAAMMLASPAWAHGHHHGGYEHHGGYAYGGFRYNGHHHGGARRHHFEGYHHRYRSELRPMDDQASCEEPASLGVPPSRNEVC